MTRSTKFHKAARRWDVSEGVGAAKVKAQLQMSRRWAEDTSRNTSNQHENIVYLRRVRRDKIIEKRISTNHRLNAKVNAGKERGESDLLKEIEQHDVIKYGLIPELVGRLPVIVGMSQLDETSLVRILKEPKNSIVKQYTHLFALEGVELEFDDEALGAIAAEAVKKNIGARGLRSIMERVMIDLMYKIPSDEGIVKVRITRECVTGKGEPVITRIAGKRVMPAAYLPESTKRDRKRA